ncbi:ABC transporter permease [Streptomyces sp. ACA25]|uniref:ABC transporter permease n=1 Tax=Streptomyces sp. ACA25 TaxID=3022596 RepID=UPI00230805BF|nr:ABC transporter permease [Streptomyces sp. ACA25]MDB1089553.1 ABC transporter permease [Streptomyces sp. ACA25]
MTALTQALGDGAVIARRNVIKNQRVPDVLVSSTVAPIVFILLFAYVFGSAIDVPGSGYREYLIAGILVQSMLFTASNTAVGLADDLKKGVVDRFRSLPISQSAVLVGRTTSDLINNVIVLTVMAITGLLVGWRIRSSALDAVMGFALLFLFAYAASWLMAVVGLMVRSTEVLANVILMTILPLTFISNAFVPTEGLPGPLRVMAEWNPISAVVQASRELFGNTAPQAAAVQSEAWPLQNAVPASLLWIAVLLIVFVPLAIHRYQKAVSR